jgi:hypothetical protein|tara:strand:- start:131 stop:499 length:369 start_codon:yes stop_codon:yes gene_type:complete
VYSTGVPVLIQGSKMSDFEEKLVQAELNVPIYCTNEFDVDEDGNSYIVNVIYVGDDEDEPTEIRVGFEDVIEEMIAEYGDTDGYQFLYMIAHELSRQANALRSKANYIEDSTNAVGRLFDLD